MVEVVPADMEAVAPALATALAPVTAVAPVAFKLFHQPSIDHKDMLTER